MKNFKKRIIIGQWRLGWIALVLWGTGFVDAQDPSGTARIKALFQQVKQLHARRQEAEKLPGMEGVEKINRLEERLQVLEKEIQKQHPNWSLKQLGENDGFLAGRMQAGAPDFLSAQALNQTIAETKMTGQGKNKDSTAYAAFLKQQHDHITHQIQQLHKQLEATHDAQKHTHILQRIQSLNQQNTLILRSLKDLSLPTDHGALAYRAPHQAQDQRNADADYITTLQDKLQQVYRDIFHTRGESLALTKSDSTYAHAGKKLETLGRTITELEKQEQSLKKRLLSLGQKPQEPQVLKEGGTAHKSSKRDADRYAHKLKQRIHTMEKEIQETKALIAKQTSGQGMTRLGSRLHQLETQRHLLVTSLADVLQERQKNKDGNPSVQEGTKNSSAPHAASSKAKTTTSAQHGGQGTASSSAQASDASHDADESISARGRTLPPLKLYTYQAPLWQVPYGASEQTSRPARESELDASRHPRNDAQRIQQKAQRIADLFSKET